MASPARGSEITPEPRHVSTAQVARALGVSVTTVKRWVDEEILPAHRTAGGHRKLLVADVLRLVRDTNLPHADLSQLIPRSCEAGLGDPDAVLAQLVEALAVPDLGRVRSLIHGAYDRGFSVEAIADRILAPAMAEIGSRWQNGTMAIMHEHRATQAVIGAVHELRFRLRERVEADYPVAVGGAPEHDHFILPTMLVGMSLLDAGWDAVDLGPHTPFSAFQTALDELRPQLVWVSVSHLTDADRFLCEYREFQRLAEDRGVFVAIGGRGLPESVRAKMLYTTYGDGLGQLLSFARQIHRLPSRPKRGRPPIPGAAIAPAKTVVNPDSLSEPEVG